MPAEVMDPWLKFNAQHQLPAMDAGLGTTATTGDVKIEVGETEIIFHDMELAPACGMYGQNYSRYVYIFN